MLMSKKISTHLKEAPVTTCVVTELGEYVERADKN
jgi:hypothetical protein